jgi:hypothetical protein
MANPTVDKITSELSSAFERWFDRCRKAIASARDGHYPFEQFAADVTDTWVDGTYVSLLPVSLLGGVSLERQQRLPVLRFKLLNKNDVVRYVLVPGLSSVTSMAAEHLVEPSGTQQIPNGSITLSKVASTDYLQVALAGLSALTIRAGLYSGRIIGQPMNAPIARIEVDFP